MADPARRTRTFEELYREIQRLPEGLTGEILEEGVLRTMSRPGKRHRLAAVACLDALRGANANLRGSGWWIEVEVERSHSPVASRCRSLQGGGWSEWRSFPTRI